MLQILRYKLTLLTRVSFRVLILGLPKYIHFARFIYLKFTQIDRYYQ